MAWPVAGVTAPTVYRGSIPTGTPIEITSSTVYLSFVRFTLAAGATAAVTVQLTNSAGDQIESDVVVMPGVGFRLHAEFEHCVGLKVVADVSGATYQVQVN